MHFMNLLLGLIPPTSVRIHSYAPRCRPSLICILPLTSETKFYTHKETGKIDVIFIVIFMFCNNKGEDNRSEE